MPPQTPLPTATLHTLPHADGSVTYKHNDYEILATVNGPIEPQRRDELPEEAFLEVVVRPPSGGGSPRDRLLESLLHRTLSALVDLAAHPRSLIQVTLQLVRTPQDLVSVGPPHQSDSVLPPLPALVNAAVLALLSGNIPLLCTCVAVGIDGAKAEKYVFGYSSKGDLLLAQGEGDLDLEGWAEAEKKGLKECRGPGGLEGWMRGLVEADLKSRNRWRGQD